MARFIQPDTIIPGAGNPLAWDRYAYTLNNPVNRIDPTGHDSCMAWNGSNCVVGEDGTYYQNGFKSDSVIPISNNLLAATNGDPDAPPDFDNADNEGVPPHPNVDGLPDDGWVLNPDDDWVNVDDPTGTVYDPHGVYKNKKGTEGEVPHWNLRKPGSAPRDYPSNPKWGRPGQRKYPGVFNPKTGLYEAVLAGLVTYLGYQALDSFVGSFENVRPVWGGGFGGGGWSVARDRYR